MSSFTLKRCNAHSSDKDQFDFEGLTDLVQHRIFSHQFLTVPDLANLRQTNKHLRNNVKLYTLETLKRQFGVDPARPLSAFHALMNCTKERKRCFEFIWKMIQSDELSNRFEFNDNQIRALAYSAIRDDQMNVLNTMEIEIDPKYSHIKAQCEYMTMLYRYVQGKIDVNEDLDLAAMSQLLTNQELFERKLKEGGILSTDTLVWSALEAGASVNPFMDEKLEGFEWLSRQSPEVALSNVRFLAENGLELQLLWQKEWGRVRYLADDILLNGFHVLMKQSLEARCPLGSIYKLIEQTAEKVRLLLSDFGITATLTTDATRVRSYTFTWGSRSRSKYPIADMRASFSTPGLLDESLDQPSESCGQAPVAESFVSLMKNLLENGAPMLKRGTIKLTVESLNNFNEFDHFITTAMYA